VELVVTAPLIVTSPVLMKLMNWKGEGKFDFEIIKNGKFEFQI